MALSPDGRLLASGGQGSVTLWDTARGVRLASLPIPADTEPPPALADSRGLDSVAAPASADDEPLSGGPEVEALAFSADGRLLAGTTPHDGGLRVRVWDVARRAPIATRDSEGDVPSGPAWLDAPGVAFSPDGRQVAFNDDEVVAVWDLADSSRTRVYRGEAWMTRLSRAQGAWLRSTAGASTASNTGDHRAEFPFELFAGFSRSGHVRVAGQSGQGGGLVVTDARSGRLLLKLSAAEAGPPATWQLSPDGSVLYTAGPGGAVNVWDVPRRSRIITLTGAAGAISDLTLSRDGRLLVCADVGGTIRVWDQARLPLIGHSAAVKAVAYSPDGDTLATGGADSTARLWDPAGRTVRAVLRTRPDQQVNAIAYAPDATTLAVGGDRSVQWWNIADRRRPKPLPFRDESGVAIKGLAFSPDGTDLATLNADGTVTLTDTRTHHVTGVEGDVIAYRPGGELASTPGPDRDPSRLPIPRLHRRRRAHHRPRLQP